MPYATMSDGAQLHFQIEGREQGAVVLLSHSLGTDLRLWARQAAALKERFLVVGYDLRGHGQSDAPAGAYALERLGRDALELLDHLGAATAGFCGVSMGGGVGQWLAANAADRISRLVLANTTAVFATPAIWQQRLELVQREGMGSVAAGTLERWFTPEFRQQAPGEVARAEAMLLACRPEGYASCCAALRDADLRADLARITAPTLVICGRHDEATPPAQSEALVSAIAGAQLVALDAAHLSCIEQADLFNAELSRFLG
jgi:3-oxoadipate enol-lactonase